MNRVLKWAIIAFVAWWVVKDPAAAGAEVQKLAGFATQAASGIATAISSA